MLRICYRSRAAMGLRPIDVTNIVERSAWRNRDVGITGLLLFNGLEFLQVIEGPVAITEHLMDRIETDLRHRRISILSEEDVTQRLFPFWTMRFKAYGNTMCRLPNWAYSEDDIVDEFCPGMPQHIIIFLREFQRRGLRAAA